MKNVSENLLKMWGHVGFLMFSHLQHKIFVAETNKKKSNQFEFSFLVQQQNILGKMLQNKEI